MNTSDVDCNVRFNFTQRLTSPKTQCILSPSRKVVATSSLKRGEIVLTEEYAILVDVPESLTVMHTMTALFDDIKSTHRFVDLCEQQGMYPRTEEEFKHCARLIYGAELVNTQWVYLSTKECKCLYYIRMNAHVVGDKSYIYTTASAINSSCSPNCIFCIDADGKIYIQAISDIQCGEELTTAYYPGLITEPCKDIRQALTLHHQGFLCECHYCMSDSKACRCLRCGRSDAKVLKCSRCKTVSYCSRECQADHWVAIHKDECKR